MMRCAAANDGRTDESAGGETLRRFFFTGDAKNLQEILQNERGHEKQTVDISTEMTKSNIKICSVFFRFPGVFSLILRESSTIIYPEACMSIFRRNFDGIHASEKALWR